jgi:hypothetical protein
MKSIKFIYGLLILGIGVVWAVIYFRDQSNPSSEVTGKTQITITKKIIDVGETMQHVPAEAKFEILNSGTRPLVIADINTDCNCTVPDFDSIPIMPGKKTYVSLIYNAHSPGYFQKKAFVTCNADNNPIILIIRGKVVEKSSATALK